MKGDGVPDVTSSQLAVLLRPEHLTRVVDIGANPIDGDPPYKPLLARRLCRVVGFEPQPEALARLDAAKSDLETYLPHAVGDGQRRTLHICAASGMTSLLEPDAHVLSHFPGLADWARVLDRRQVDTVALSAVPEIGGIEMLKMDLQGGERAVLEGAGDTLAETVCIQLEVSFVPLYKGQAPYGEMDLALRARGFIPHMMASTSRRMILPLRGPDVYAALNQLVEGDAVYVRNFLEPDGMTAEQLKHLVLIAHYCYRSFDLALNGLHHLARRGAVPADAPAQYMGIVQAGG
ncbi:FkbM family methyltransferase [Xanthobacter wiegelii]|uniref:FkbM family methyltransferase n=1 Tax=Xanthobacter wiegelii TaxID=3119913 RepID=UPI0037280D21